MSPKADHAEFLAAFVIEGDEHLRNASANLLEIEAAERAGKSNVKAMRELFRGIHTLKGLSAMVAVEPIVAITHRMETALRAANQQGGRLSLESIDALLQGAKAIGQRLGQVREGKAADAPSAALLERLEAVAGELPVPAPSPSLPLDPGLVAKLSPLERVQLEAGLAAGMRAVRADFAPTPEAAALGVNITSVREAVAKLGEIVKVTPVSGPKGLVFSLLILTRETDSALAAAVGVDRSAIQLLAAASPASPELPDDDDAKSMQGWGIVRVEVSRLDDALERLSSLIVTRFRMVAAVGRMTEAGVDTRELNLILKDQVRQQRELRASILKMRMVSVAEVLERVPLLLHGLMRATGKRVRLELDVGKCEIDKAVAERLFPAIVHLLHNAVDHAIEAPQVRAAAGKPEEGLIRISCVEKSNSNLELCVTDDGCGIDPSRIARRAGRDVPTSDPALLELLCRPGLTTLDEATTTSGRGMGMNIVRRVAVTDLGGELSLATTPGRSTTFTLKVPLTLSIVDAFTLECGGQRFLVPVAAVEEILEIDAAQVTHAPDLAQRGPRAVAMLERRGESIPMLSLEALFTPGPGGGSKKALVIRRGTEAMAFGVDRMLGQQEVVVRPLADPLIRVLGISGSSDLGDGQPTLVLDLLTLASSLLASRAGSPEVLH